MKWLVCYLKIMTPFHLLLILLRAFSPRGQSTNHCTAVPAFRVHTGSPCCPWEPGDPGIPGVPVQDWQSYRETPGSLIHVREYSKTFNTKVNWPSAALPAVSPNTGRQKRERSQVSPLLWYRIRVTAPPVKPCKHNYNAKEAAILHSQWRHHKSSVIWFWLGRIIKGCWKCFSHSFNISPCHSCPGGLPQACPGLHSLPWHQPCLAPPATHGNSPHHSPPEETRNRFHAREIDMAKGGKSLG